MTTTPQPDATALGASQSSMALLRNWADEKKWDKALPYAHGLMASGCRDPEVFRALANLFGDSSRSHLAAFFGELAVEYGDRQNVDLLVRLGNWYRDLGDLQVARE